MFFPALIAWAKTEMLQNGLIFLFLFSFTEAFIQPVPVEPLLAGAVGIHLQTPLFLLLFTAVSSILGGALGFFLGKKLGHPVFLKIFRKNGPKWMERGEKFFAKWGFWAVVIGTFTFIPFKIISWLSGIFEMKFWQFLLAAFCARTLRFALVVYGVHFFLQ